MYFLTVPKKTEPDLVYTVTRDGRNWDNSASLLRERLNTPGRTSWTYVHRTLHNTLWLEGAKRGYKWVSTGMCVFASWHLAGKISGLQPLYGPLPSIHWLERHYHYFFLLGVVIPLVTRLICCVSFPSHLSGSPLPEVLTQGCEYLLKLRPGHHTCWNPPT